MATYGALRSYRDTTTVEVQTVQPGAETRQTETATIAFGRPNRLRLEGVRYGAGSSAVVSDGKSLTTYQDLFAQYTRQPAPDTLAAAALALPMGAPVGDLVYRLLLSSDPGGTPMEGVERIEDYGEQEWQGVPVRVFGLEKPAVLLVAGRLPPGVGTGVSAEVRLWVGAEDLLIHQAQYEVDLGRIAAELPAAQRSQMGAMAGHRWVVTESHAGILANRALPDSVFSYAPPATAALVERFGTAATGSDPNLLVGRPAPQFALADLAGQEVRLADLLGQVVLIDFWATWCGPCRQETPTLVSLQSLYADLGFTVVGLAVDDQADKVRSYADQNGIRYPVLMADDQEKEDYGGLVGIPTTFLVDRKGVVRYAHLGTPDDRLALQKQVEVLLAEPR